MKSDNCSIPNITGQFLLQSGYNEEVEKIIAFQYLMQQVSSYYTL